MGNCCAHIDEKNETEINKNGQKIDQNEENAAAVVIQRAYRNSKESSQISKNQNNDNLLPESFKANQLPEFPEQPNTTVAIMNKVPHKTMENVRQPSNLDNIVGPFKTENGDVYHGQIKKEQKHGWGKQLWSNTTYYEGWWQHDNTEGWGQLIYPKGECFVGEWVNGQVCGYGEYYNEEGAVYKGHWKNDKQHGYGVEEWNDDSRYEGNYSDGMKQGGG